MRDVLRCGSTQFAEDTSSLFRLNAIFCRKCIRIRRISFSPSWCFEVVLFAEKPALCRSQLQRLHYTATKIGADKAAANTPSTVWRHTLQTKSLVSTSGCEKKKTYEKDSRRAGSGRAARVRGHWTLPRASKVAPPLISRCTGEPQRLLRLFRL